MTPGLRTWDGESTAEEIEQRGAGGRLALAEKDPEGKTIVITFPTYDVHVYSQEP
ncbi:MAG: hypothetical protein JWM53_5991 [bacterium]|nr:hypothetical protein [bacterium]